MGTVGFSNLQRANLSMLITIRDDIKKDLVSACCKYGIQADQARVIENLSIDHVLAIVANLGEQCLFPPRQDFFQLLDVPVPLAGPLASVHPPSAVESESGSGKGNSAQSGGPEAAK